MTIDVNNILRLALNYRLPALDIAQSIFHFQYIDAPSVDEEDVLDDLETWALGWAFGWQLISSNQIEIEDIDVSVFTSLLAFNGIGTRNLNIIGNALTDMLPPGNGILMTRQVANSKGVAKKFPPGLTEGQQDKGEVDIATLIAALPLAGAYAANPDVYVGVTRNYRHVTHQKQFNIGKLIQAPVAIDPITAYQRRRKQNVGS